MFIAGTLTLSKAMGIEPPCGQTSECERVLNSGASAVLGIPLAYIGLAAYVVFAVLAAIRLFAPKATARKLVLPGFLMALFGAAESVYLQYYSIFTIHSICKWCLASAITMVITLIVYAVLAQTDPEPAEAATVSPLLLDTGLAIGLPLLFIIAMTVQREVIISSNLPAEVSGEVSISNLVPADANIYGDPAAPITVVEFADMCCPVCRKKTPEMHDFVDQHKGKIRLVYRHFPLMSLPDHKMAAPAALVGEYAAEKHQFWPYLMTVMSLPDPPTQIDQVFAVASQMGFNIDDVKKRISDDKDPVFERMYRDLQTANKIGIRATPTFFVIGPDKSIVQSDSTNIAEVLNEPKYKTVLDGHA